MESQIEKNSVACYYFFRQRLEQFFVNLFICFVSGQPLKQTNKKVNKKTCSKKCFLSKDDEDAVPPEEDCSSLVRNLPDIIVPAEHAARHKVHFHNTGSFFFMV
jgi:hypothetical protein